MLEKLNLFNKTEKEDFIPKNVELEELKKDKPWYDKNLPLFAKRLMQFVLVSGALTLAHDKLSAQTDEYEEQIRIENLASQDSAKKAEDLILKFLKEVDSKEYTLVVKSGYKGNKIAQRIETVKIIGNSIVFKLMRPYGSTDGMTEYWVDKNLDGEPDVKIEIDRIVGSPIIEDTTTSDETKNAIKNYKMREAIIESIIKLNLQGSLEENLKEFNSGHEEERNIAQERIVYFRDGSKWKVLNYKEHKLEEKTLNFINQDFECDANLIAKDFSKESKVNKDK